MSKKFISLLAIAYFCASTMALAAGTPNTVPAKPTNMKMPPEQTKIRAAAEECRTSVAKDAQGRPDMMAMRECMEKKGFQPKSKEMAEREKKIQAAFNECNAATPKGADGKPEREALRACMEKKGIAPARPVGAAQAKPAQARPAPARPASR